MNTHKKKLVASTLIAGAVSLGTAGLASFGAGAAGAGTYSDLPCNPSYYHCGAPKVPYIPVVQGPGIPR